jgi:hypothetical protein
MFVASADWFVQFVSSNQKPYGAPAWLRIRSDEPDCAIITMSTLS